MRDLAELYIQQFKTTLAMMFQYRASLVIWTIGQVLEPLVYLIVWSIISESTGGSVGTYTTAGFAAYFLILMVVNQFTYTWVMYVFEWRVREGLLSFALLKPVHPIHSDVSDNIASKIITLPIVLLVAVGLAMIFHASISTPAWAIALFFPALLLAFVVRFLLEWTLSLAAFWTTRVSAVNQTYFVVMLFLSGQIAPLTLLPGPVQVIASILPFRWMLGFPVELLLGRHTLTEAAAGLGAQIVWLFVSLILMRIIWRRGLRVYSAVGA